MSLWMGYESYVMEIRMYGDLLSLNYDDFSGLAANNTWNKNLWELLQEFEVRATFGTEMQLLPV